MGYQIVVVILDASVSRDISWVSIGEALQRLPLNSEASDHKLTFLGVLHLVTNPLGYKSKVNSSLINTRTVEEELARKKEQFLENLEILKQTSLGEIQVEFELVAGSSRKEVAVKAAKRLGATWVILDREIKKDKRYFMKNLSCRISKMKRDNRIEEVRGNIKKLVNNEFSPSASNNYKINDILDNDQVSYDEMIPGDSSEEQYSSHKRGSVGTQRSTTAKAPNDTAYEQQPTVAEVCGSQCNYSEIKENPNLGSKIGLIVEKEETSFPTLEAKEYYHQSSNVTFSESSDKFSKEREEEEEEINMGMISSNQTEEAVGNLVCSVCGNRRPRIAWHKDFSYAELHEATDGFSRENFLSEGGFGSVFMGELKNRLKIAVKQLKNASLQGEKEFKSEVDVLSKARHENLVMLLGSCSEGSHRLLVYEYVCFASLDRHLSKDAPKPLTWDKRIKIALGGAKGLEYLHHQNIVHRDMRPSNILITHDYESLLGDFGLAKGQHDSSEDNVVGTLGYMAPEYAQTGKVSTKTDVYSFGVVLLQLITGLSTTDKIPHGKSLVGWARPLLIDKNYPDLIDRRIIDSHDFLQLFWMVQLTEKCLSVDPANRFTMEQVVDTLKSIKNGNTCIGNFSPISDSVIGIIDFSEGEAREEEEEGKSK